MSDVEWYVEIEGQRTGPVSPSDLVAMYQAGKLPGNAMATTSRMQGDWVTIADLVEAYRELNQSQKKTGPTASTDNWNRSSVGDGPSFQPPPRPTEQLEASKIINLNTPPPSEAPMDATESLFLAIQAVREKSAAKNASSQSNLPIHSPIAPKDPGSGKNQLIIVLVILFMVSAYGISRLMKSDPNSSSKAVGAVSNSTPEPITTPTQPSSPPARSTFPARAGAPQSKLLTEGGGGAVRTAPPVNIPPAMPRGGGAVRMGEAERVDHRDPRDAAAEFRERRDLRNSGRDSREAKDLDSRDRDNAPTIRDEFGEAVDRPEEDGGVPRDTRGDPTAQPIMNPEEDQQLDAGFPSTMEGVAPEQ